MSSCEFDFDVLPSSEPQPTDDIDRHRRRRATLAVAAAIVFSVGIGLVVGRVADDDAVDPPAATVPVPTTPPLESIPPADGAPTTTTTGAPMSMDELTSIRALMWADDYFISGFVPIDPLLVTLDGAVAQDLPACRPFLDTVFESDARPAAIRSKAFGNESLDAMVLQYVVVHPTLAQATAMLDGMQDPAFLDECMPAYESTLPVQCCDDVTSWIPIEAGDEELDAPTIEVDADDILVRRYRVGWIDDQGVPRGPIEIAFAAIRVGDIVTSIQVILADADGDPVASVNDFQAIVQNLANRAEVARHGP